MKPQTNTVKVTQKSLTKYTCIIQCPYNKQKKTYADIMSHF